jgi:hypothetical protein
MARDQHPPTFDYYDLQWIEERLFLAVVEARVGSAEKLPARELASLLAPVVRAMMLAADRAGAQGDTSPGTFANPTPGGLRLIATRLEKDRSAGTAVRKWAAENTKRLADVWESRQTSEPVRLGELVSGERVLLRRAVGIVNELQRLEHEVRAVLDAFAESPSSWRGLGVPYRSAGEVAADLATPDGGLYKMRNGAYHLTSCDLVVSDGEARCSCFAATDRIPDPTPKIKD